MIIEIKKISDLKPAPYNPRLSTEKQEKNLQESLSKFGVVEPIIFNKQTGYIVGGHFRVRELKKLGYKEVECVIVDLSEEDEKELNIRLNANTGDWDWEELGNSWDAEQLEEWGLNIPHFEVDREEEAPTGHGLFPLSIILTKSDYAKWQSLKKGYGIKGDTEAFLKLFNETTVTI